MYTPLCVLRSTTENSNEELPPRRLVDLEVELSTCEHTSPSTGDVTAENICSEENLLETRVEESNVLQLEQVSSTEEAKYPELQFSLGYARDNERKYLLLRNISYLTTHPLAPFLEYE